MRVRSLGKAGDDWSALRNHRMEHYGFAVSTEFYQQVPFFWNREGCQLNMLGHYRGASIFMICNGPSLASGKMDLSLLKRPGIMTYGMNNGPRTIRPNLWTCVDDPRRFLKSIWFDPCITKIVPHTFAEKRIFDNEKWADMKTLAGQCPNLMYFHRNEKFMPERWLIEDTINWGNSKDHGGGRSVMLAILKIMFLLGFRNVFLLGADFTMSGDYTYHFDEQREHGAVKGNNSTYQKLMYEYFPKLKPYFDAEGFNVYNCNPESELKVFDYVPYEDAIAFASANLGDVDNERTWGMYSKPKERQQWIAEPQDNQKAHLRNIPGRVTTPVYDSRAAQVAPQMQQQQQQQVVPQVVQQAPQVQQAPMPQAQPMPQVHHVQLAPQQAPQQVQQQAPQQIMQQPMPQQVQQMRGMPQSRPMPPPGPPPRMPRSKQAPQVQQAPQAPQAPQVQQLPNGGQQISLPRSKQVPKAPPIVVQENVETFNLAEDPNAVQDGRVLSPVPCGTGSTGSSIIQQNQQNQQNQG